MPVIVSEPSSSCFKSVRFLEYAILIPLLFPRLASILIPNLLYFISPPKTLRKEVSPLPIHSRIDIGLSILKDVSVSIMPLLIIVNGLFPIKFALSVILAIVSDTPIDSKGFTKI